MSFVRKTKKGSLPKDESSNSTPSPRTRSAPVSLPSGFNKPSADFHDYYCAIYGEKGVGKSSLVAQFQRGKRKALLSMWERYRKNLPVLQIPKDGEPALDWERFEAYVDKIIDNGDIGTIGIDTIDRAYKAAAMHHCKRVGLSSPLGVEDYGKTWEKCSDVFAGTLSRLAENDIKFVFVSHAKLKMNKTAIGSVEQVIPSCWNQPWEYVKECCDFVFYYGYRHREHVLQIRGDSNVVYTACGVDDHFMHPKSGLPLEQIPMGTNPKEAYKNLMLAWENKLPGYTAEDNIAEEEAVDEDE